jgi:hypothetical protein
LSSPQKTIASGRGIDIVAEQILGEIQTGVGEPAGARHPVPVDQYAFAPLADHAAERPDERPELLGRSIDHCHSDS